MKYAILVYETPEQLSGRSDPAKMQAYWGAYGAYSQALKDANVAAGGTALQPSTLATTVRITADKRVVQDGPYADTKEQLGGMFIVDVPDLDHALEWASRCPSATGGAVEVRPLLEMK